MGATSALVSISLFIAAGKNKRKANLALKGELVVIGNKILSESTYTALAFKIQL